MKIKYKIIVIIVALFCVQSCDLDFAPENVLVDEIVYSDAKTAEAALLGAYNRLNSLLSGAPTGTNNYASGGYVYRFAEIGTPSLTLRKNSYLNAMETAKYTQSERDGYVLEIYRAAYNSIDYANNIIDNIKKSGNYELELMNQHVAEAKFIRAYEYFTLLELFGDGALVGEEGNLGVVIRRSAYEGYNPDNVEGRSTVKETYDFIITDLKEALNYLPTKLLNSLELRARASRTAAFALLSRVYLYRGTFRNNKEYIKLAESYADSVINNTQGIEFTGKYSHLLSDMFPYNPTNDETNTQNYSNEVILLEPSYSSVKEYQNGLGESYFKKGSYYVSKEFIEFYEEGDVRGYIETAVGKSPQSLLWLGSPTSYPDEKTSYKYNNGRGYNNVIYLRLSEFFLTKAEAKARIEGVNQVSIDLLNKIHTRAYKVSPSLYEASDFSSTEELVERILKERLKELAYEGHTRFDFIRTGRDLNNKALPNNKKILPIPDYEIKISNGIIKQNSGF